MQNMDQLPSPTDLTSFNTEEYYEVERIVNHGFNEEGTWYLVRWKGYGPESDTWEPESAFMHRNFVRKYLKKFEKRLARENRIRTGHEKPSPTAEEPAAIVSGVNESLGQEMVESESNNNDSMDQHSQDLAPYPAYHRHRNDFRKSEWKVADILNDRYTYLGTKELLVRWQNIEDESICFHWWELQSSLDSCGAIVKFYTEG